MSSTNILLAIKTLVNSQIIDVIEYYRSENKMNAAGDALELFVKDIFANSLHETAIEKKEETHSKVFSWGGNANNPPDFMIRGGDAIEVKKITSPTARIALNSSYPSAKLLVNSLMITSGCRQCEVWQEKDIIYTIGYLEKQTNKKFQLSYLWLVYGDCYAASKEIYERVRSKIIQGIAEIEGVELSATKELARVNKVDPLGITNLRVRGMWDIENPNKVYYYLNLPNNQSTFKVFALMRKTKFLSFPQENQKGINDLVEAQKIQVRDVKIKSPDNTMERIDAKLMIYQI